MSHQILNLDELYSLEKRYNGLLPPGELMRRAGKVVAQGVASMAEPGAHVVFICGPETMAATALPLPSYSRTRASESRALSLVATDRKPKMQRICLMHGPQPGGVTIAYPYNADKASVVVDALFGTGMTKPLAGDFQDAAMWFNERQALHISIDIPSGLDPMTGNWVGGVKGCMADITICMLAPKAGCFMNVGADASGHVLIDELEVSVPLSTVGLISNDFPSCL